MGSNMLVSKLAHQPDYSMKNETSNLYWLNRRHAHHLISHWSIWNIERVALYLIILLKIMCLNRLLYIEISFSESSTFIVKTICLLVVWLHIRAHVSRSVANKLLRAIQFILTTTLSLVEAALGLSGINVLLSGIELPRDIRTAYQLYSFEPEIIRTACCPNCYSLFPQPIPERCQWKASPRSRPCNTKLWKIQNTRKGPKHIPHTLYTTQSFDSWLQFFLSRQIIETSLEEAFRKHTDNPTIFGADMNDIQDSPAWRDLLGFFQSPRNLIFGIYIDWFNPLTNKIAGKRNFYV